MEQVLLKMARQLDALDETSLMTLWDKYAETVSHFEPSKRWEEAVLVLSLIQAKHWKNQLFNQRFAASVRPAAGALDVRVPAFSLEKAPDKNAPRAQVLAFRRPEARPEEKN